MKVKAVFSVTCLLLALQLFAQKASLKGYVYDSETGQPIVYANIILKETKFGTTTNIDGYYALTNVTPNDYELQITCLGYDTIKSKIHLKDKQVLKKDFFLSYKNIMLNEVAISGKMQSQKKETNISVQSVSPKTIKMIPSVGGQADIAQYLEIIPGITTTGDQGGELYIRGGMPVENKVLLDGMIIYNPFHSIGSASVFDTDIIQSADIYTGAFSAEYGGRLSSIMDITTRPGNRNGFKGRLDANTFGSKILVEGPISNKKQKAYNSSFILSAKKGYMNQSIGLLAEECKLPYSYEDIYSKVTFAGRNGNKLKIFGFKFDDEVDYPNTSFDWNSHGFGVSNVFVPSMNTTIIETNFAYSDYSMTHKDISNYPSISKINSFNAGMTFTNFMNKHELKHGFEFVGYTTDFNYRMEDTSLIDQQDNTSEINAFATSKMYFGNIIIEPGIRFNYYASLPMKRFSPEPRLSLKYLVTENFRIKMGTGVYTQNLISSKSTKDIVNHFYGYLSGNENIPSTFKGKEVNYYQQKAIHLIAGIEYNFFSNSTFNAEGFLKEYPQIVTINRYKQYPYQYLEEDDFPEYLLKDYTIETGQVKGIDLSIDHSKQHYSLWLAYSYSYSKRQNELHSYFPSFDRRHEANALLTLYFGKQKDLVLSTRWNIASGFPYTKINTFYPLMNYTEVSLEEPNNFNIYKNKNGISFADYNAERLPYYHRLDISLMKRFKIKNIITVETNLA